MLAMHYAIVLDDDHDMSAIRARVAEKAPRFDSYPGLAFKAFVMTERGEWRQGEPARNLYGAFYLWDDDAAATAFLRSEDFAAVSQSFGRPEVLIWLAFDSLLPAAAGLGPAPRVATFERVYLPRAVRPVDALGRTGGMRGVTHGPAAGFIGIEPQTWEAVRISLWPDEAAVPATAGKARRYEVLHLSAPQTRTPELAATG